MRKVYKFLHARDLDAVLNDGTVKIGSLSHYRGLEGDQQWINDQLEGRVKLALDEMIVTEHENRINPLMPAGMGNFARAESGGVINLSGATFVFEAPEVYVFSASTGELSALTDVMCREGKEPYDACIQIRDIAHLAHRLFYRGRILALNDEKMPLNGEKMSSVFQTVKYSEVRYDVLSRSAEDGQVPSADPFLKDVGFARQSEVRIVFLPRNAALPPTLLVRVPRPEQLFKEIFREPPSGTDLLTRINRPSSVAT